MAAQFYNISAEEMSQFLVSQGFKAIHVPNALEMVFSKRVDQGKNQLSLRVFTGIVQGESRGVGDDAIRVALFFRDGGPKKGKIVKLSGSKRVHRVVNWRQNLQARLDNWLECYPKEACPDCGSPMLKRRGKNGEFFGCCRYPICKGSRNQ